MQNVLHIFMWLAMTLITANLKVNLLSQWLKSMAVREVVWSFLNKNMDGSSKEILKTNRSSKISRLSLRRLISISDNSIDDSLSPIPFYSLSHSLQFVFILFYSLCLGISLITMYSWQDKLINITNQHDHQNQQALPKQVDTLILSSPGRYHIILSRTPTPHSTDTVLQLIQEEYGLE